MVVDPVVHQGERRVMERDSFAYAAEEFAGGWLLGFEQGGVQLQETKLTGQVNADQLVFAGQAFGKLLLAHTTRSCISLLRKGTYIGMIS